VPAGSRGTPCRLRGGCVPREGRRAPLSREPAATSHGEGRGGSKRPGAHLRQAPAAAARHQSQGPAPAEATQAAAAAAAKEQQLLAAP
jgi:hypothetical protein